MFNPEADGPAAIRGGCTRCQDLLSIYQNHQQTLKLMRTFAPPPPPRPKPADLDAERQQTLFTVHA